MKKERLSDAIGQLDDEIIEETAQVRDKAGSKRHRPLAWASVAAACAVLALAVGLKVLPSMFESDNDELPYVTSVTVTSDEEEPEITTATDENDEPEVTTSSDEEDVPKVTTVTDEEDEPGELPDLPLITPELEVGMGFEGYDVDDISELYNGNPWTPEFELDTLPVYNNPIVYEGEWHLPVGADYEEMENMLLRTAQALGIDTDNVTVSDNGYSEEQTLEIRAMYEKVSGEVPPDEYFYPTMLYIETEEYRISVDQRLNIDIDFTKPFVLPDGYNFGTSATDEENTEAALYLAEKYSGLFELMGIEDPLVDTKGGSAGYSGGIVCFDAGETEIESVLNYNFNYIVLYDKSSTPESDLYIIRLGNFDYRGKLGDYPIISSDEALELLGEGKYITTVAMYDFPGTEYVGRVELIYRVTDLEEYYIPYYRFYVEIPEGAKDGKKLYGAYYVPAVRQEYISDMTVWDGHFNN